MIYQNSPLDIHLFQSLEQKLEKVEFIRVDSEVNDVLVNKESSAMDAGNVRTLHRIFNRALGQKVEASFSKESYQDFLKKYPKAVEALTPYITQSGEQSLIDLMALPQETVESLGETAMQELQEHAFSELKIEVKSLKTKDIPGMIVFSEFMRRWHDMDMISRMGASGDMLKHHTLVLNPENEIIQKLLELEKAGKNEEVDTISAYIHDLSLLEQKPFSGEELKSFIKKANKVLSYLG